MFTLPTALKVDEFENASPEAIKAAIELAIIQTRADCVKDVFACVDGSDIAGAMVTRQQYATAEKVLRQLSQVLGETIKHGGTGKPVVVHSSTSVPTGEPLASREFTDYELPEMPTRKPAAQSPSVPMPEQQPAAASSGGRRQRKVS